MATEAPAAPVVDKTPPKIIEAAHTPQGDVAPPKAPALKSFADLTSRPTERVRGEDGKFKPKEAAPAKEPPEVKADAPAKDEKPVETKPDTRSSRQRLAEAGLEQSEAKVESAKDDDTPEPGETPAHFTEDMRKRDRQWKARNEKFMKESKAAQEAAAKEAKRAGELEAKLAEAAAKQPVRPPEWEQQETELMRLRRLHRLQDDPEVKKFDARIADSQKIVDQAVASAPTTRLPQWVKDEIKALGSLDALNRSTKTYKVNGKDGEEEITGAEVYRRALGVLDPVVLGVLAEQQRIGVEKGRFIEEETGKAKEWFENETKQQAAARQQQEAAKKEADALMGNVVKKLTVAEKWLADVEVPTTGDPAVIKSAREENQFRAQLRKLAEETANFKPSSDDPATARAEIETFYYDVMKDATRVYSVERDLKAERAKSARLQKELDDIKGAARSTPRSTNGANAPMASDKAAPDRQPNESFFAYGRRLIDLGIPDSERQAILAKAQRG